MLRFAGLAALALGLTGCMNAGQMAGRAVEHNKAIAEAQDEIVLLNIVRAMNDRPIVYTQFTGVSEDFSLETGASVSIPFGADAGSFYDAGISAGPSQYVSLSTRTLDDVDYYQGVMRPVQTNLLRYYLDNGWPRDLLFALTVEKLNIGVDFYNRVVADSDAICAASNNAACERIRDPSRAQAPAPEAGRVVFYNDPRSPELFDPFHNLVLRLIVLGITVDGAYVKETVRVSSAELGSTASEIRKLVDMGANVRAVGDVYEVTLQTWRPALRLPNLSGSNVRIEGEVAGPENIDMMASLRSPDSIMFYLGAYARDGGADARVMIGGPGRERFVDVIQIADCADAVIEVEYEGGCYGIPRDGDQVSMKVVAFLHQVFGLNKRASDPPVPSVVRTVN